jgi:hypothetical protein
MERAPGTLRIRGWVGPRAGLDVVVKRRIPSPCRDSNPVSSSPYPSAINVYMNPSQKMDIEEI